MSLPVTAGRSRRCRAAAPPPRWRPARAAAVARGVGIGRDSVGGRLVPAPRLRAAAAQHPRLAFPDGLRLGHNGSDRVTHAAVAIGREPHDDVRGAHPRAGAVHVRRAVLIPQPRLAVGAPGPLDPRGERPRTGGTKPGGGLGLGSCERLAGRAVREERVGWSRGRGVVGRRVTQEAGPGVQVVGGGTIVRAPVGVGRRVDADVDDVRRPHRGRERGVGA
jgi:hypothetical protein